MVVYLFHVLALSFPICICIGLIWTFIWVVRLCDSEWVSCRVLFPRGDLELFVYMAWCGAIRDTIFTLILLLIMSKHCQTRWYYRWDAFQHMYVYSFVHKDSAACHPKLYFQPSCNILMKKYIFFQFILGFWNLFKITYTFLDAICITSQWPLVLLRQWINL